MTKIKAILFDMDGVLVDAKDWHYEAFNLALENFGYNPISRKDHLECYDGLPTRKKLALLAYEQGVKVAQFEDINTLKQKYTYEIAEQKFRPRRKHIEALSHLRDDGYKMTVCSNSVPETIKMFMENGGLAEFLEFTLSNQDVTHPKPDPEIYQKAMRMLGLQPSECLVLEDNFHGIEAARASGAHVMIIGDVREVNYRNITREIAKIESTEGQRHVQYEYSHSYGW